MNSYLSIFKELRAHRKLAQKRDPMYDQSKFAKFFLGFMALYIIAIMVLFGFLFEPMLKEVAPGMEPYHVLNKGMWFFLIADFGLRFMAQKLPATELKPYVLLPLGKKRVMSCYLLMNGMSLYNLVWWFMLLPFACVSIWKYYHLLGVLGFLVGYWLLMVMNGYWHSLCRALINEHILWTLLPIGLYALIVVGMFVPEGFSLMTVGMELGEGFILWEAWAFLAVIALAALFFWLNLVFQTRIVDKEMSRTKVTKLKKVREYKFLDRFGEIGEYMRLEIKLLTRNKVPKTQLRTGLILMIMFSVMLSFSDVYDGQFMRYFIAIYNVSVLGVMVLSQTMMFEGNYLDGLMSRKESILSLLKAKYYLHCVVCIVPILIMIAPVVKGKLAVLDILAALFITTGVVFFIMFQLAVYNKSTMNLNQKVMGRNSTGNWFQSLLIMAGFFLPIVAIMGLQALFGETTGILVMLCIGIAFTLLHPLWLRNVYRRFMNRRYENMEGFRASRA